MNNKQIESCMPISLDGPLPPDPLFEEDIRRAPRRKADLSEKERAKALKSAIRYITDQDPKKMAPEFLREINERGEI